MGIMKCLDAFNYYTWYKIGLKTKVDVKNIKKSNVILFMLLFNDTIRTTVMKEFTNFNLIFKYNIGYKLLYL